MSNNAAVTPDGGEIGRAQALQALACRAELHTDMNPVLLKHQSDKAATVIVHGKMQGTLGAEYSRSPKGELLNAGLPSYLCPRATASMLPVGGGGSPHKI